MINENNSLIGLPSDSEVSPALERLRKRIETLGIEVVDDFSTTDHARFIGIFEDETITLYPKVAPVFAQWFTIAHLYGHMIQLLHETPRVERANSLVLRLGVELSADDVQLIYDHEREAAEIGRALVAAVEPDLPLDMDQAYSRFFHADFRYLINVIETAESGTAAFARFWKREPVPRDLIAPDARPLIHIPDLPDDDRIVVV